MVLWPDKKSYSSRARSFVIIRSLVKPSDLPSHVWPWHTSHWHSMKGGSVLGKPWPPPEEISGPSRGISKEHSYYDSRIRHKTRYDKKITAAVEGEWQARSIYFLPP